MTVNLTSFSPKSGFNLSSDHVSPTTVHILRERPTWKWSNLGINFWDVIKTTGSTLNKFFAALSWCFLLFLLAYKALRLCFPFWLWLPFSMFSTPLASGFLGLSSSSSPSTSSQYFPTPTSHLLAPVFLSLAIYTIFSQGKVPNLLYSPLLWLILLRPSVCLDVRGECWNEHLQNP